MELRRYITLLGRWIWLIVLITALGAGGGLALSLSTTPIYQASTTLLIDESRSSNATTDYNSVLTSERLARTYAQTVIAQPVLDKVINTLRLNMNVDELGKRLTVRVVRDTQLMVLTVEDPHPERATQIANEIVKQFLSQDQQQNASRYTTSKQGLQAELTNIQQDMTRTQASLATLKTPAAPGSADMSERDRLEALLAQYRSSYATLLKSLEDIRLAEAQTTTNLVVVEPARPEGDPARPKTLLNLALGAAIGLLLAVGLIVLRDFFDDTVKSTDDVEGLIDLSTLGVISNVHGARERDHLVSNMSVRSPVVEAYRVLATNIEFAEVDNPIHSILVTSGSPAEGKTTTTANLAVTLAQLGKRVIVVDVDLRKPSLHKYFGLSNARGVTTALLDHNSSPADYLFASGIENLRVLPSGPVPPNSARLIGSQRMADLLTELKSLADVVVIDSPPTLVLADATLLARMCDATLLVIRAGATTRAGLKRTHEHLAQASTRLIGTVINRLSARGAGYYYTYYYGDNNKSAKQAWWRRFTARPAKRPAKRPGSISAAGGPLADEVINR